MKDIIFNFNDLNVTILGGSKGIGREVCKQFLNSGAKVISISRTPCDLLGVENLLCDITNVDSLKKTLNTIDDIDILVNVAGTNLCEPIEKINCQEWDRVINTNLRSFFIAIQHASQIMKKKNFGKIVNVSSIAGRNKSLVSGVHYTASKHGIVGLTKQSAQELGPYGINVNCVCPSQTMTEMLKNSMSNEQIKKLSDNIPARRISSVEEQANPILFLCTSAANYIHGAAIDINGGQL